MKSTKAISIGTKVNTNRDGTVFGPKKLTGTLDSMRSGVIMGLLTALGITTLFIATGLLESDSVLTFIGLTIIAWVAVENGGNDVSRGIAPLVAAKEISVRGALVFGAIVTAVGGLVAMFVAVNMLKLFTTGLLNTNYSITTPTVIAIALGAALWIAFATKFSLPVSTTHSIIGSVAIVGLLSFGVTGVLWGSLALKVVLPLLFSPLIGWGFAWILTSLINNLKFRPQVERWSTWIFSGSICFVRAVNDTPKIVGIAVLVAFVTLNDLALSNVWPYFLFITVAMSVGSYVKGILVTETLAYKVSKMNSKSSLSTSISTSVLVMISSGYGLPVSTTHVATSSIVGSGMYQGTESINWSVVKNIVLSWVCTLPGAGLFGLIGFYVIKLFLN
ncbi:inorganic phosphate transporter [Bacillus alkalicellulosilyticus]|uniref:inorganic phosphate transporter n=1 Tax=Alkalihalobacterium alkalicellulosilyticum TaxID=1912214 RepID=UPI000996D7BF|nr:inorganic phosphate transporter [Bacillus alkalicellulosilyticus]